MHMEKSPSQTDKVDKLKIPEVWSLFFLSIPYFKLIFPFRLETFIFSWSSAKLFLLVWTSTQNFYGRSNHLFVVLIVFVKSLSWALLNKQQLLQSENLVNSHNKEFVLDKIIAFLQVEQARAGIDALALAQNTINQLRDNFLSIEKYD